MPATTVIDLEAEQREARTRESVRLAAIAAQAASRSLWAISHRPQPTARPVLLPTES